MLGKFLADLLIDDLVSIIEVMSDRKWLVVTAGLDFNYPDIILEDDRMRYLIQTYDVSDDFLIAHCSADQWQQVLKHHKVGDYIFTRVDSNHKFAISKSESPNVVVDVATLANFAYSIRIQVNVTRDLDEVESWFMIQHSEYFRIADVCNRKLAHEDLLYIYTKSSMNDRKWLANRYPEIFQKKDIY
jgi:hypothetical protein